MTTGDTIDSTSPTVEESGFSPAIRAVMASKPMYAASRKNVAETA
jgi:hypothetical protein